MYEEYIELIKKYKRMLEDGKIKEMKIYHDDESYMNYAHKVMKDPIELTDNQSISKMLDIKKDFIEVTYDNVGYMVPYKNISYIKVKFM